MARPLPDLDLVRGFDAAARHLSFTRAGAELFLTQSAVSRQIKSLEDQLGVVLFRRRHRALALTDAGWHFHQAVSDALRLLQQAAARVRGAASRRLTLSTTIGFASLWLIPRLNDFRARHPDVEIRIDANNRLVDLAADEVDIAIRYCTPDLAPPGAARLFGEQVVVVCSPRLLRDRPLVEPADLAHHVMLHYERTGGVAPWSTWAVWLEAQGVAGLKPAGSVSYTAFDHMVQAAVEGQGIALAPSPLVRRLIESRQLVAPLKAITGSTRAYYLLVEPSAARRPQARQFIDWLLQQAQEEVRAGAQRPDARPPARAVAPTRRKAAPGATTRRQGAGAARRARR
jgi:DNA-binding transcriptional LysR family regulator